MKLIENINKQLFESYIPMQRNRKHGSRMQFDTFIDEYVSIIAKYINTLNTKTPKPNIHYTQFVRLDSKA